MIIIWSITWKFVFISSTYNCHIIIHKYYCRLISHNYLSIFKKKWTNRSFRPKKIGGKGFNLESYAWGVACELREALKGLIEEIEG